MSGSTTVPGRRSVAHRLVAAASAALLVLVLAPPGAVDAAPGRGGPPPGTPAQPPGLADELVVEVLSSAPDQVTGGDARIAVQAPRQVPPQQVRVTLNGDDVTEVFSVDRDARRLEGVVTGMELGENRLVVSSNGRGQARPQTAVTLVNHPASGPVFSGPQQQPFVCTTARYGLGQPLVDNQDAIGIPVAAEDENGEYPRDGRGYPTAEADIVGWSKDCAAETDVRWLARTTGGSWVPWSPGDPAPPDIATADVLDGPSGVPFLVRQERGTSNRFIYSIATLVDPADPHTPVWNDRLVFNLQGGVAIGRTQGNVSESAQLRVDTLAQGYAVVNSTGLRTNTHYNLQLGGETALMLKERFVVGYGVPRYTIGVGGSGGAIQQYAYAQNHPGLLDALVPQLSYPDMVTQTLHVGECELLEYYMDVLDADNPKWRQPAYRRALQGLNVVEEPQNWSENDIARFNGLAQAYQAFSIPLIDRSPTSPLLSGQGECRKGWQGLTPLVLNPTFTNVSDLDKLAQDVSEVEWTHWADLSNIYGTDETGFARVPWDNVGVQYGLRAFVDGLIDHEEFVELNALVGGWKRTGEMVPEGFPFTTLTPTPATFDPWSSRNATDLVGDVRPRTQGDLLAIERAHTSGMVFQGDIDVPVIDWRPYLEEELDMHNTHQSFAVRQRILDAKGEADNHVIWFTDARPSSQFDQTMQAFAVLDEWLLNLEADPSLSVAEAKPAAAVDSCFRTDGSLWYAGDDVWAGILDDGPPGPCTEAFETFTTSRIEAGAPINGDVFKCATKPLAQAVADGTYGERGDGFTTLQLERLGRAFPEGVCDRAVPPVRGPGG